MKTLFLLLFLMVISCATAGVIPRSPLSTTKIAPPSLVDCSCVPDGNDSGQVAMWNGARWKADWMNYFGNGNVTMTSALILNEIRPPSLGTLILYGSLDIFGGHDSLKQIIFEKPDGAQYIHVMDLYDSYHDTIPNTTGQFLIGLGGNLPVSSLNSGTGAGDSTSWMGNSVWRVPFRFSINGDGTNPTTRDSVRLVAGTNVTITRSGNAVTVNAASGSGGTINAVKESDGSPLIALVDTLEFNSTNFVETNPSGKRATINTIQDIPITNDFVSTASATVASTTTETSIVGTGVGTATIPANFLIEGSTIAVRAYGYFSTTIAPTYTIRVKLGSTVIGTTGTVSVTGAASSYWETQFFITCRSTGAGGTVFGQGRSFDAVNLVETPMGNTGTQTINTTATQLADITWQWSASSASNTSTGTNIEIRVKK